MTIESLLIPNSLGLDDSSYQFDKSILLEKNGGSKRAIARSFLEYGYVLMERGLSQPDGITERAAVRNATDLEDSNPLALLNTVQREHCSQFIALVHPMREYDGLISDQRKVFTGFSLKISDYVSIGSFPYIGVSDLLGIVCREFTNVFTYLASGTVTPNLDLPNGCKLYAAQEDFLVYEKALDKKMLKAMKQSIKDGEIPESLSEFEVRFAHAFKTAVDDLGGIERYQKVREDLYRAHECLAESGAYTFPVSSTIAHFRRLNQIKIRIYHATQR